MNINLFYVILRVPAGPTQFSEVVFFFNKNTVKSSVREGGRSALIIELQSAKMSWPNIPIFLGT